MNGKIIILIIGSCLGIVGGVVTLIDIHIQAGIAMFFIGFILVIGVGRSVR